MNEVNINDASATIVFGKIIETFLKKYFTKDYKEIVIVCIGTDRCTGDSLGPLTGHKLERRIKDYKDVFLYGTLEEPVHAKNLSEVTETINSNHDKPFVIAIDACLGSSTRVGFVKVSSGPLKPGSGVKKDLPNIGNINIMGIVNLSGFMEFMVLQNTRLSLVMKMAESIARSIDYALWKFEKNTLIDGEFEHRHKYSNVRYLNT